MHFYQRAGPERALILVAAAVFGLAIAFRAIDEAVCLHIPLGTHFLWHIAVASVIYLAMRALMLEFRNRPAKN